MKAEDRRKNIINYLLSTTNAVSGSILSEKFGVSRQIIVQDISALKSMGYQIITNHYGYIVEKPPLCERVIKVKHSTQQTEDELNTVIDLGGTVVDVFVWHKVYGRIQADLNIVSKMHVKQFINGVRTGTSTELMNITGGYHYHTIRADNETILQKIEEALFKKGYVAQGI